MNREGKRRVWWLAALGLAFWAGCQQAPKQPTHSVGLFQNEPPPKLDEAQKGDVLCAFARTMENTGEVEQAMMTYKEVIRKNPERIDAAIRLGRLLDHHGRFEESEQVYRQALKTQPDNADLHCNLGYSLYLQHRWGEAADTLREAVRLQPGHRRAHNNLGLVLASLGDKRQALRAFHEAGCTPADAHANLAYVLTLRRNWGEARQHYQQALALAPSSPVAQKGLKQLGVVVAKVPDARPAVAQDARLAPPIPGTPGGSSPYRPVSYEEPK